MEDRVRTAMQTWPSASSTNQPREKSQKAAWPRLRTKGCVTNLREEREDTNSDSRLRIEREVELVEVDGEVVAVVLACDVVLQTKTQQGSGRNPPWHMRVCLRSKSRR